MNTVKTSPVSLRPLHSTIAASFPTSLGTKAFFAHPYTSWERPQNERRNGLFCAFVPKEASIEVFSDEDTLSAADELNGRPRKKLGYHTPEELFDAFLDAVFAA